MDVVYGGCTANKRQDIANWSPTMGAKESQTSIDIIEKCIQAIQHVGEGIESMARILIRN